MPFKDPEKRREYRRKWYAANRDSEKKHVLKRKKELRKWFRDYKKKLKCLKCNENHPAVLEFHHKNEKKMDVAKMVYEGYSKKRILLEISKCKVLCANCHKKEHYRS
jgi:hypothetical protein